MDLLKQPKEAMWIVTACFLLGIVTGTVCGLIVIRQYHSWTGSPRDTESIEAEADLRREFNRLMGIDEIYQRDCTERDQ